MEWLGATEKKFGGEVWARRAKFNYNLVVVCPLSSDSEKLISWGAPWWLLGSLLRLLKPWACGLELKQCCSSQCFPILGSQKSDRELGGSQHVDLL